MTSTGSLLGDCRGHPAERLQQHLLILFIYLFMYLLYIKLEVWKPDMVVLMSLIPACRRQKQVDIF